MLIVGTINSKQEAMEIQEIAKRFVVGNRARVLSRQMKNQEIMEKISTRKIRK